MENDVFFIVPHFAVKELNLSGNNLLIFSLIYSFKRPISLSYEWIASRINCTRRSAINSIKCLSEKHYIIIKSNETNFNTYSINSEIFSPIVNFPSENNSLISEINSPNNNNNNNIKDNYSIIGKTQYYFSYNDFIKLKKEFKTAYAISDVSFECWIQPITNDGVCFDKNTNKYTLFLKCRTNASVHFRFKEKYFNDFKTFTLSHTQLNDVILL